MKTARSDIKRDKRKVTCKNSSWLGFSSSTLRYGDFFLYEEEYTDGSKERIFAKCHGRVRPLTDSRWKILAQVINHTLEFTYERWIDPDDVLRTLPKEKTNKHILRAFEEMEDE